MPVAALSKAQYCVLSFAAFGVSNPYKGMDAGPSGHAV